MQKDLFEEAPASPAIIPGESYYKLEFSGTDFSNADFSDAEFESCKFIDCNLSNINVSGTKFSEVVFIESKLMGIPFLHSNPFAIEISFIGSRLISCNFTEMKLRRTAFTKCELTECFFQESDLSGSDFSDSVFSETLFHNTNLEKCNFSGAQGYSINPVNNNIRKAVFTAPDVLNLLNDFDIKIKLPQDN